MDEHDQQDQAQDQTQEQAPVEQSQAVASTQEQPHDQPQDQALVGSSGQVPAQVASGGNAVQAAFERVGDELMAVVTEQVEHALERLREEAVTLSPAKWSQAMDAFGQWCLSVEARLAALEGRKGQDQTQG